MTNMIGKQVIMSLLVSILVLGLAGCTKNDGPSYNGGSNLPVFDFSTRSAHTLNVKYNVPKGYNIYFEVYTQNPLEFNQESGQTVLKAGLQAIDKGYTDENGKYSDQLVVPSYVKEVYVYTPNAGVEPLMIAKIKNGVLEDASVAGFRSESTTGASRGIASRAGVLYNEVDYRGMPNMTTKTLGSWEHYLDGYASFPNAPANVLSEKQAKLWGRPNYLKYVDQTFFPGVGEPVTTLDAVIWNTIKATLPGKDLPQSAYDVLSDGDVHITKPSTFDINMHEVNGGYMNTLAYYCYKTDEKPEFSDDIKTQVLAFPNAKLIRDYVEPYRPGVFSYGSMRPGEGIRLRYIDQNGVDHGETFPAGVSIGWVLYSDGYARAINSVANLGKPSIGRSPIYSNPILNFNNQHVALFRHNDVVVLAFEDVVKTGRNDVRDYDDLIFSIKASDPSSITDAIPDKDPEPEPKPEDVVTTVTSQGIVLFEDLWPFRGDFDMNDVVVKYVSNIDYNKNNQILGSTEYFTILWSGAEMNNSFAYQNPNIGVGATVTFEGGVGNPTIDATDKTIIRLANNVLDYANKPTKTTFTVKTKYSIPLSRRDFILPPYNPFIIANNNLAKEVHLTNMKPTSYADMTILGTKHDFSNTMESKYYITYDEQGQQMPFGIDMLFENTEALDKFVIPAEMKKINIYYPGFIKWISSGGKTDSDWYLHPQAN